MSERVQGVGVYSDGVCGGGRGGDVHPCQRGPHLDVDQDSALLLAAACDNNGEYSTHIYIIVWIIVDH